VSLSKRLKTFKPFQLAFIAFYAVTGLILLAFLPLTGYPPHLGFLGIFSLITAYSLFAKRGWSPWIVAILFIVNTAFSLDVLFSIGFSNMVVAVSMLAYAVLTWMFTAYLLLKRKD
jgi:NAD/NADP transhydrogenase beta subunit